MVKVRKMNLSAPQTTLFCFLSNSEGIFLNAFLYISVKKLATWTSSFINKTFFYGKLCHHVQTLVW